MSTEENGAKVIVGAGVAGGSSPVTASYSSPVVDSGAGWYSSAVPGSVGSNVATSGVEAVGGGGPGGQVIQRVERVYVNDYEWFNVTFSDGREKRSTVP